MHQLLIALAFGVGIPGAVGAFGVLVGITKDGSPFKRSFWTA